MTAATVRHRHPFTHVAKRWLYVTHRWIGIVTCLFLFPETKGKPLA